MFSHSEIATLEAILRNAARQEVLPRFRNLGAGAIRQKTSATDLVTDADEAAERAISAALGAAFPMAVIIGEEAASADGRILEKLKDAELAFVVDPIDGTFNFASGVPLFATMAAAIVKGEIVAAVIHDPMVDDSAMALLGKGAWSQRSDGEQRRLQAARPVAMDEMTGMASWRYLAEPFRSRLPSRYPRVADASGYRCCGHEYRMAAAGSCHFLIYGKMMPWDHAPGSLIHREAGGYSALFDGSPYDPAVQAGGLLCAPDRASWEMLREVLLAP